MPIPFRDDDSNALRTAAYLHILPTGNGFAGALFQIGGQGEPVEFTWNQVNAPPSILWRPGDLRRFALRLLAGTLFETTRTMPELLLVSGDDVPAEVLRDDLQVKIPTLSVRVTSDGEIVEDWVIEPPQDSSATGLAVLLRERGLLLEPFARAEEGLREALGD